MFCKVYAAPKTWTLHFFHNECFQVLFRCLFVVKTLCIDSTCVYIYLYNYTSTLYIYNDNMYITFISTIHVVPPRKDVV